MEKIGSEFIDDFNKSNSELFGVNWRFILLIFSIFSFIGIIVAVEFFEYPPIIYKTYLFLVAVPGIFFGTEADKKLKIKDRIYFLFLEKRRVYKTELENIKKGDK